MNELIEPYLIETNNNYRNAISHTFTIKTEK